MQSKRDGITVDTSGGTRLFNAVAKLLPPLSNAQMDDFWLANTKNVHVSTASAIGYIGVADPHDRRMQIACGRVWQRIHLHATTLGIAMQPLNQIPERLTREEGLGAERRFAKALAAITRDDALHPLMMFRVGYPLRDAAPSPRRPLRDVLS